VRLATRLCLVPRLRMSGAVLLLPLYAFMAWTGTSLLLPLVADTILILFSYLKQRSPKRHLHTLFSQRRFLFFFFTEREPVVTVLNVTLFVLHSYSLREMYVNIKSKAVVPAGTSTMRSSVTCHATGRAAICRAKYSATARRRFVTWFYRNNNNNNNNCSTIVLSLLLAQ
jgi:hypothetical protein